jgi:hypothetical protein
MVEEIGFCPFLNGLASHLGHRMPPKLGLFSGFYLNTPPLKENRSATLTGAGGMTSKLGSDVLVES